MFHMSASKRAWNRPSLEKSHPFNIVMTLNKRDIYKCDGVPVLRYAPNAQAFNVFFPNLYSKPEFGIFSRSFCLGGPVVPWPWPFFFKAHCLGDEGAVYAKCFCFYSYQCSRAAVPFLFFAFAVTK